MFPPRVRTFVSFLILALFSACSGSSGGNEAGEFGGEMYVSFCSLGCTNGRGGESVFCAVVDVFQNQEVAVRFSEPIEPSSVSSSSFRVVDVSNGTTPPGQFFLDPTDPRRLIFRPALTFDEFGTPVHGFEDGHAYEILIPGTAQSDDPPFIRSVAGRANSSRLRCTILTTGGINDPVPGDPRLTVFVDVVTEYGPDGEPRETRSEAVTSDPELIDVFRDTEFRFVFADVMNPATLVNPSTGVAPFLTVALDVDGEIATDADRIELSGSYSFEVDLGRLETRLLFVPDLSLPSAGPDPDAPRRVVIDVPAGVVDLTGRPMRPENGGGEVALRPETILFEEIEVAESFQISAGGEGSTEDERRSGASWGGGRLTHSFGGGSGRLGDLILRAGEVVVLDTDEQSFPLEGSDPDVTGNRDASGEFPTTVTVTDGVFEFATVQLQSGSVLRLEGSNAARIYCRGPFDVELGSVIDVSGASAPAHDSRTAMPELEVELPAAPASSGAGGFGADRFDHSASQSFPFQPPPSDPISNVGADTRGRDGAGVGGAGSLGAGRGGIQFPELMPPESFTLIDVFPHSMSVDSLFNPGTGMFECRSAMVGGVGSGGAYATDGRRGVPVSPVGTTEFPGACCILDPAPGECPPCVLVNNPPPTVGGASAELGLAPPSATNTGYVRRVLDWQSGFLQGGAGGGGGGNHPFWTATTGVPGASPCIGGIAFFTEWHDHSGAAGGSGGGAVHLVSGRRLSIDGVIDASGGNGGSGLAALEVDDFGRFAMPGGGGSGGAIRLQGIVVVLGANAGRLDVRGGSGGRTFFDNSFGGSGGTGLIRIEDRNTGPDQIDATRLAPSILPTGPENSVDFLSVAPEAWTTPDERPGSMTSSSSCWIRPEGSFFSLRFSGDTGTLPEEQGWNLDVLWEPAGGGPEIVIPFRGDNTMFPGSFEDEFGRLLGHELEPGESAAPIVVRFQGAHLAAPVGNLCDLDVADPTTPLVSGSLTPWVDHPSRLNDWPIPPNVVRFAVTFDGTRDAASGDVPGEVLYGNVRGVTNLRVRVTPE
ncbi:MAG: hypothetical protein GY711_06630 [bacterium]|nr:hypothetical protein [bacterium]